MSPFTIMQQPAEMPLLHLYCTCVSLLYLLVFGMCKVCSYVCVYSAFLCVISTVYHCTAAKSKWRVEGHERSDANQVCFKEEEGDASDGACRKRGAVFTDAWAPYPSSPHQTQCIDLFAIPCMYAWSYPFCILTHCARCIQYILDCAI